MGVHVKATCSECLATHATNLEFGQENIRCPACGHTMNNLPEGELNELETVQKKQRLQCIIALVCATLATISLFQWAFTMKMDDVTIWMAGTIIFLLGTLICGVLGSLKRHVVEF